MNTQIRRFVVYGAPWFTTTLEDAVPVNIPLRQVHRHESVSELFAAHEEERGVVRG